MKKAITLLVIISGLSFNASFCQSPTLSWARTVGSASVDEGMSVMTDASGNVYSCGYFSGTVDFDPGVGTTNLTSAGVTDIYIQKYAPSGNFLWAKRIGGTSNDYGYSITVDAAGNSYTTGYFQNTVDFDPNAGTTNINSAGLYDMFVLKLDPSGNLSWVKQIGGTSFEVGNAINLDNAGNIYTTGFFSGTTDFDPSAGTFTIAAGSDDIFIMKMDPSGNLIWVKSIGSSLHEEGKAIDTDNSGNVYITGSYQTNMDFDPSPVSTFTIMPTNYDGFVLKLDAGGNFNWAKKIGGINADHGNSLTVAPNGNVYTTGDFTGTVDFDPSAGTYNLSSTGSYNAYVQKLDINGNFIWARNIGTGGTTLPYSIALDGLENTYTTGYFTNSVDFDPSASSFSLTALAGTDDLFLQKMDANGNFGWAIQIGGTFYDGGESVYPDAFGSIYLTGHFQNTVDFDPGVAVDNHTSNGGAYDIFVMKLSSTSPLSVELQDLSNTCNNGEIEILWSTTSETNNDYFSIEKSSDASIWNEIGQVDGAGNSNMLINYSFMDHGNTSSTYYRLKQVDFNGTSKTYGPFSVQCNDNTEKIILYPNPSRGNFAIDLGKNDEITNIGITNTEGKLVYSNTFSNTSFINLSLNVPPGLYFVNLQTIDGNTNIKLLIQ